VEKIIKNLDYVITYYPIVGHSLMEIDGDFGRIELNKRNYQRIYHPSEYTRIIKNTNIKNPINVFSVNHSLFSDNSQIVKVLDYKKKLSPILKNQLNHCSCVRKITFTKKDIKISLTLSEDFEQSLELFKPNFDKKLLNNYLEDLQFAYQNFLPISREKLYDIMKIIEFIPNSVDKKFYDSLYSLETAEMSNGHKLMHTLFEKSNKVLKSSKK
jgi:hypothetical protein